MFPKTYSQLTIGKYQQLHKIMEMDFPESFDRDIRILALLGDKKVADIEAMNIQDFNEARVRISFIYTQGSFPLPASFWLKGVMYRVNTDPRKINAGGYIDITKLTSNKKEITGNIHLIMATLCTPFQLGIKKDTKQTVEERAELFRKYLTMDKVLPVTVFFLKLSKKLRINIQSFLLEEVIRKAKKIAREVVTK